MPRLDLKGVPLARPDGHQQKALDILEEIKARMNDMGLPEYPKPKREVVPLSDIDLETLSNRELEQHLAGYTAYATWLLPKFVEATSAHKAAEINLKHIKAKLKIDLYKDNTPKQEIEARVQVAPQYTEQELEVLKLFAVREVLEAHYKSYSKQAATLSRIVETRKLEWEQDQRSNNVSNFKKKTSGGLPRSQLRRP